jgi:MYXO-CTERM domain-containing protein
MTRAWRFASLMGIGLGVALALPAVARAAGPTVCGSDPALGAWTAANCPTMLATPTGGVYMLSVALPQGPTQYKVLPSGAFDGTELGSLCKCTSGAATGYVSAVGGCSCNLAIDLPTAGMVTFYYDTRTLDASWAPVPTSHGDTASALYTPAGVAQQWVAMGTFQMDLGATKDYSSCDTATVMVDDGTHGDATAGDGIYTFQFVAPRDYTATGSPPVGDQWKAVSFQSDVGCDFVGATKFGADGWSYDTSSTFCTADGTHQCVDAQNQALVAAMGQTVTLEFDALHGHLHETVTGSATVDAGTVDAKVADAGVPDARTTDAQAIDAQAATPSDALAAPDAGSTDAAVVDATPGLEGTGNVDVRVTAREATTGDSVAPDSALASGDTQGLPPQSSPGCGCHTAGAPPSGEGAWVVAAAVLSLGLLVARRRYRRRVS